VKQSKAIQKVALKENEGLRDALWPEMVQNLRGDPGGESHARDELYLTTGGGDAF
jgi:hypothetical protein